MADDWLGISSLHLNSFCGEEAVGMLAAALDGFYRWQHYVDEIHWFVLDLGQTYTIKKVRARSNQSGWDPTYVNIYIDDNNPPTTLIEEGITTWRYTDNWVEIDITDSDGRYIKVEIRATDNIFDWIRFGHSDENEPIFDAYGDIAEAPPPPVNRFMRPRKYW